MFGLSQSSRNRKLAKSVLRMVFKSLETFLNRFNFPWKLKIQNANFSTESKSLTEELMKPKTGKRENLSVPGNYLAWLKSITGMFLSSELQRSNWVPKVTNINFLLTRSICCQKKWLWELIKMITKDKMLWFVVKLLQLIL